MMAVGFLSIFLFCKTESFSNILVSKTIPARGNVLSISEALANNVDAFEDFTSDGGEEYNIEDMLEKYDSEKFIDEKQMKKPKKRTKTQIKKMKFLMTQDVKNLIQDKDPSATIKAWQNIKRLQKLYQLDGDLDYKPTVSTYNILVRAYAKSGAPDAPMMAESILNQMLKIYEKTCDCDLKPNIITYTEVIDAYARSNQKNSAVKAEQILSKIMTESERNTKSNSTGECVAATSTTFDTGMYL